MDTLLACRLAWERVQDQQPLFEIGVPPMAPYDAAAVLTTPPEGERAAASPTPSHTTAVSSQTLDGSLREPTAEGA